MPNAFTPSAADADARHLSDAAFAAARLAPAALDPVVDALAVETTPHVIALAAQRCIAMRRVENRNDLRTAYLAAADALRRHI